jgi:hypothetical protein
MVNTIDSELPNKSTTKKPWIKSIQGWSWITVLVFMEAEREGSMTHNFSLYK